MAKTSLHTHTAVARLFGVSYRLSCILFCKRRDRTEAIENVHVQKWRIYCTKTNSSFNIAYG